MDLFFQTEQIFKNINTLNANKLQIQYTVRSMQILIKAYTEVITARATSRKLLYYVLVNENKIYVICYIKLKHCNMFIVCIEVNR